MALSGYLVDEAKDITSIDMPHKSSLCLLSTVYHMLSLFHILMHRSQLQKPFLSLSLSFFLFFFCSLYLCIMHKCCLFCPYPPLAPSFSCPSLVSFMFPFLASSAKVSCHFVRHICIAVPRGKQWLEKRCGWKGKTKRQNKNKEVWPVNGRQGSITSHIIWYITQLF